MGSNGSPPHVVIFPFMAQGHTLPLLDLSRALACRGTRVTIITTPANAPFILSKTSTHPAISLHVIPFPNVEELPEGCENVNHLPSPDLFVPFINATKPLRQPFEHILKEMCYSDSTTPICVISDMFLPWTVDSCCLFDIPRIVFSGMGVLPTVIVGNASSHVPCISSLHHSEPVNLPSVPFSLNKTDFPDLFWCADDKHPMLPILSELQQAEYNSWGIVVNSFEELEGDHVDAFEYQKETRAWLVGPLLLHDQIKQDLMNSGSGNSYMTDLQMEEIALGLEMAGEQFIWVVRSKTWVPPVGWEERVGERGYVAMGLKAGLMVPQEHDAKGDPMPVQHNVICDAVKELMRGDQGKKARERARELGRKARQAVGKRWII
ncbi:hypothetical protein OIU78_006039 [Salix suchowensis]|nr:hypothetical protein OIU78_006039 [Salix suchowensis]